MENGHRPSNAEQPPPLVPSYKMCACALIAGILLVANAVLDGQPPQPSPAQARSASAQDDRPARPAPRNTPTPTGVPALPPSDPVRMMIPAIGVNAPMSRLELDHTGTLQTPPAEQPGLAGWYGDGTAPGAVGTAITAGHVYTPMGPGVFYRLGALTKGDKVEVVREDHRTAVFTVDAVEVHDKRDFPDEKVYGDSDRPELRVITCGGDYSRSTGYQGNVVVYATLSAVR